MIQHRTSKQVLAQTVEWMKTPAERARGLLKYSEAPKNFAAIFKLPLNGIFPVVHTFGMNFAIDILFCDRSGKVLFKKAKVPPMRLVVPWARFLGGCAYLVEFSTCDLSGVSVGDGLQWEGL